MIPKSLSASSIAVFENCPARWKAEYETKAPGTGGSAASLGTACHAALEEWVTAGHYQAGYTDKKAVEVMKKLYDVAYYQSFADDTRYGEGLDMVLNWLARQDWTGRKVLMAEVKEHFDLDSSVGPIIFNYIWDRCDELEDGDIEVIDYKTIMVPVSPEELRSRIQARMYGVAAQIKYPNAKRIWVTFDQLRHQPVGVVFTKEENREAWAYLRGLVERILADDGSYEKLNSECRYCLRRHACETLQKHITAQGPLGITDPMEAADARARYDGAKKALEAIISELDEVIIAHLEEQEIDGYETSSTRVELTTTKRRQPPDTQMARRLLGDELVAAHSKMTMAEVDALLKGSQLTPEQKAGLKALIRSNVNAGIRTRDLNGLSV